jgi:hypothetical protein
MINMRRGLTRSSHMKTQTEVKRQAYIINDVREVGF